MKTLIFVTLLSLSAFAQEGAQNKVLTTKYEEDPHPTGICKFDGANEVEFPCSSVQCTDFRKNTSDPFIKTSCIESSEDRIKEYFEKRNKDNQYESPCPGKDELVGFYTKQSCEMACQAMYSRVTFSYHHLKATPKLLDEAGWYRCEKDKSYANQYRPGVAWYKCVIVSPGKNCVTKKIGQNDKVTADKQSGDSDVYKDPTATPQMKKGGQKQPKSTSVH